MYRNVATEISPDRIGQTEKSGAPFRDRPKLVKFVPLFTYQLL